MSSYYYICVLIPGSDTTARGNVRGAAGAGAGAGAGATAGRGSGGGGESRAGFCTPYRRERAPYRKASGRNAFWEESVPGGNTRKGSAREYSTERVMQREEHRVHSLPLRFQLREEDDKCEVPSFARQRGASGGAEAVDMSQRDTPISKISKISERGGDPHFLSPSGVAEAADVLLYMCPPPHTAIYVPPLVLSVCGGADAAEERGMRLRMRVIRVLSLRGGADAADADADAVEKSDELTKPLSDELTKPGGPLSDNTLTRSHQGRVAYVSICQHRSAYVSIRL